jgi:hypothetical protein
MRGKILSENNKTIEYRDHYHDVKTAISFIHCMFIRYVFKSMEKVLDLFVMVENQSAVALQAILRDTL